MDLIRELIGALDVDRAQAEAAAGGALGVLQQHVPEGALDTLFAKAPEALRWIQQAAPGLTPEPPGQGGGSLGAVGALLGGGATGGILEGSAAIQRAIKVIEGLGVAPELAARVLPLVLRFVEEKLGKDDFQALTSQAPVLDRLGVLGGAKVGSGGGLGSLLGGLLK